MDWFRKRVQAIPRRGWGVGLLFLAQEYAVYRAGAFLSRLLGTESYAFSCKIPVIDDGIPLMPVFVIVYLFAYVFWVCGTAAVFLTDRRNTVNYLAGLSLAYAVGFLFFVFLPTVMDRAAEGLMVTGNRSGVFRWLLGIVYAADGGEKGNNLFPSYHCLTSVCCYLGVRGRPEISRGFRVYSLVMAVLISLSAVLTKQHYFLDVIGGVGIAIICFKVIRRLDPGKRAERKTPEE